VLTFHHKLLMWAGRLAQYPDSYSFRRRLLNGLPTEYRNHLAWYEGISAEHSSIDEIVRKARHFETVLVTTRPGCDPDRDSSHDSHVSNAESHEDSTSSEHGDMSDGGAGPVDGREAPTDQDDSSESGQYDEGSEAEGSHTAEHDEDSEEENSYPEFDGCTTPSDERDQGDDSDGAREENSYLEEFGGNAAPMTPSTTTMIRTSIRTMKTMRTPDGGLVHRRV